MTGISNFQVIAILLIIGILLAPAGLLFYAAVKAGEFIGRRSAALIAGGAVLLALTSLDFLLSGIAGAYLEPTEFASFSMAFVAIDRIMNYIALLAIAFGILSWKRQLQSREEIQEPAITRVEPAGES